jgi:hypothetical protein
LVKIFARKISLNFEIEFLVLLWLKGCSGRGTVRYEALISFDPHRQTQAIKGRMIISDLVRFGYFGCVFRLKIVLATLI